MVTVLFCQLLHASGTPYLPFFADDLKKFKAGLKTYIFQQIFNILKS